MNNFWSSYLCNLTHKMSLWGVLNSFKWAEPEKSCVPAQIHPGAIHCYFIGNWKVLFHYFFLSGVVWYKYSHPRLFIFYYYIYSPDHFIRFSLWAWASMDFRTIFTDGCCSMCDFQLPHFSVRINQNGYLNCWHFHATCRSL